MVPQPLEKAHPLLEMTRTLKEMFRTALEMVPSVTEMAKRHVPFISTGDYSVVYSITDQIIIK